MQRIIYSFLALFLLLLTGCDPPYETDPKRIFAAGPPAFKSVKLDGRSIHYAETGVENGPVVLFIHGTPGSWQAFGAYLGDAELAAKARLISLDRPGFGNSDPGNLDLSFASQATLFKKIVEPYLSSGPVILVGHSLGAPVAARMAMDYPEMFAGLLLVAPSLDPELEYPRWYNLAADLLLISWLVPEQLALANREVMALRPELQDMVPLWSKIRVPVVLIQGMEDDLVDPGNADFAERVIGDGQLKVVRVDGEGHFILWENTPLIKGELLALLETTES